MNEFQGLEITTPHQETWRKQRKPHNAGAWKPSPPWEAFAKWTLGMGQTGEAIGAFFWRLALCALPPPPPPGAVWLGRPTSWQALANEDRGAPSSCPALSAPDCGSVTDTAVGATPMHEPSPVSSHGAWGPATSLSSLSQPLPATLLASPPSTH